VTVNARETSPVAAEQHQALQNIPVSRVKDFADRLQPLVPVRFRSPEPYSSSLHPSYGQQGNHNLNPPERDTFTEACTVSPPTATNYQPWLHGEEPYPPTWTDADVAAICKTSLSQRFPHLPQDRLDSLFDPLYEKMKNENQYILSGMAGSSVSRHLYTSGDNSALGYNHVNADVGI